MSPDVLNGLEDVDFSVLDDLLNAGIRGKVNSHPRSPVPLTQNQNDYVMKQSMDRVKSWAAYYVETTTTGP